MHGTTGLFSEAVGVGTGVVTGPIVTVDDQLVYVLTGTVVVPVGVPVVVPVVAVIVLEVVVALGGVNVKVSPPVVTIVVLLKLVGTVKVLVPHTRTPDCEVTTCPSDSVIVEAVEVL